ncbi:MAG: CoA transferase [Chloroflexi bacterium]|nr:CoA transferase [Chloroflexota bacterium]
MSIDSQRKPALEGIRIVDFTHFQAGPVCSLILGDLGAEVIKVEPLDGESSRQEGFMARFGESLSFHARNRGKCSICVDVKTKAGKELVMDLVKISDVFVENYRVGAMKRLGFDYESLKAVQPRIIMVSISGYGQDGPSALKPAHDPLMYAASGIMSLTGTPEGPPMRVGVPIADRIGGMVGALATMAALYRRATTDDSQYHGEHVDVALLDGMVFSLDAMAMQYACNGVLPARVGNRSPRTGPSGYYKCKDGEAFIIASGDKRWLGLCELMGRPDLTKDPRLAKNTDRFKHHDELDAIINSWMGERTVEQVLEGCRHHDIEAQRVLGIPEVLGDPQVKLRGMFRELEHPLLGKTLYPGPLLKGQPEAANAGRPAPLLGEHNDYVCRQLLGYAEEKIRELERTGVIWRK